MIPTLLVFVWVPQHSTFVDENILDFKIPKNLAKTYVNNTRTDYSFQYSGIIGQEASQEEVFDIVARVGNSIFHEV